MRLRKSRLLNRLCLLNTLLTGQLLCADEPRSIQITDPVEYRSAVIDYSGPESTDVVARLQSQLDRGEVKLRYRGRSGYLLDVLQALDVPVASQTLVFSRTSLQEALISPKHPRAIYFNDEVAVGWVPDAPVLEIAAQDPLKGAVFYTLSQTEDHAAEGKLIPKREERCVECHLSGASLHVPGYLVRSMQVDETGERDIQAEYADVTHATPYASRWGGWFVTGRSEKMNHLGNLFGEEDNERHERDKSFRGSIADISSLSDLKHHPSAESDIVALLLLDHQAHFYNLVTRVQYEHRLGLQSDAEEKLARYALMEDEAAFPGEVVGSAEYVRWYQSAGSREGKGPMLRKLNLKTRLFEHRLSPLVKSRSFESLPNDVKTRLWTRFRKERSEILDLASSSNKTLELSQSK